MKKYLNKTYVKAIILIVLGVIFLLDMFWLLKSDSVFGFLYKLWPLFLIILGVLMLLGGDEEKESKSDSDKGSNSKD